VTAVKVECYHAGEQSPNGIVQCKLGLFGGRPHWPVCIRSCKARNLQGDDLASALRVAPVSGKHTMSALRPGDALTLVIRQLGYAEYSGCGCAAMRARMNEWGWLGCMTTHRQEICEWLQAKAKEAGVEVEQAKVSDLLVAAIIAKKTEGLT
jgi:hypothetical protein